MSNDRTWANRGGDLTEYAFSDLTPNSLFEDLQDYREILGKDFTLKDLLEVQRIKALNRIAAAITDLPELLGHEAVMAANAGLFSSISTKDIAESINDIWGRKGARRGLTSHPSPAGTSPEQCRRNAESPGSSESSAIHSA